LFWIHLIHRWKYLKVKSSRMLVHP
jgi:hypothetical protein